MSVSMCWNSVVLDVSCRTWPAAWEVGDDWPNNVSFLGDVRAMSINLCFRERYFRVIIIMEQNYNNIGQFDIVEGVNGISPNQATLHTSAGCTMPSNPNQTGWVLLELSNCKYHIDWIRQ